MLGVFKYGGAGSLRLARACSALTKHELCAWHDARDHGCKQREDALGQEILRRRAPDAHLSLYQILEVSLNQEVFREYTTSCHART
jgi:hypothetical protein